MDRSLIALLSLPASACARPQVAVTTDSSQTSPPSTVPAPPPPPPPDNATADGGASTPADTPAAKCEARTVDPAFAEMPCVGLVDRIAVREEPAEPAVEARVDDLARSALPRLLPRPDGPSVVLHGERIPQRLRGRESQGQGFLLADTMVTLADPSAGCFTDPRRPRRRSAWRAFRRM